MIRFTVCVVILAILSPFITADDPCRFESSSGVIDLSSLSHKDGKAGFPDVVPQVGSNYKYSYNPCKPFSEGTTCINVAVCQVSMDGALTFVLGTQESVKWNQGSGPGTNPFIQYSNAEKQVQVDLICVQNTPDTLIALGENPINTYKFQLTGKCACWNGCQAVNPSGDGGGVSVGLVFIIILIAGASVYLIGFTLYNRFGLHRNGAEMIPHRTFWVAVPARAKDGAVFLFRKVTGKGGLEYQSV